MIAFPLTPTFARTRVIDFSIPFAVDPMVALIPPPNEDGKVDAIIKPYKLEVQKNGIYLWSIKFIMLDQKVWISIVASMFCVAVVTWLTTKLTTKYSCPHGRETQTQAVESRLSNHILVAFEIICCQGIIYTCNSQLAKFVNCKYIFALRPICFAKYFPFDSNHNVGLVSRECRSYISLQWMLSLIPHYP